MSFTFSNVSLKWLNKCVEKLFTRVKKFMENLERRFHKIGHDSQRHSCERLWNATGVMSQSLTNSVIVTGCEYVQRWHYKTITCIHCTVQTDSRARAERESFRCQMVWLECWTRVHSTIERVKNKLMTVVVSLHLNAPVTVIVILVKYT